MPITNPGCAPNVSVPQGTIFPNGVDASPANPVIQATVRPLGWFFRKSPGYDTVRRGAHKMQSPSRFGMHFAPIQLAEDITSPSDMGLIDKSDFTKNADVADLPGSEDLTPDGKIPDEAAKANAGVYFGDSSNSPVGGTPHVERHSVADMGDRDPGRPITRAHLESYFRNPVGVFKSDYQQNPWMAILVASGIVGVVYMVAKDFEGAYGRRRGSSVVSAAGAVPASGAETAGREVRKATEVANDAATAAGKAAEEAASAAGDAAEAAGKAAEKVTESVADAVTE